jgi:hypothetical protein
MYCTYLSPFFTSIHPGLWLGVFTLISSGSLPKQSEVLSVHCWKNMQLKEKFTNYFAIKQKLFSFMLRELYCIPYALKVYAFSYFLTVIHHF